VGTLSNNQAFANMGGVEWIVDAQGCSPESLRNFDLLRTVFEEIISDLRLRPVGQTRWHQFPTTGGITGLCLLAESHLACHTFPEFGSLCLNLFCCAPRHPWDFRGRLAEMFGATAVQVRTVSRTYEQRELAVTPVFEETDRR
jgi:S-adenosylmethionine decarboxylase